MHTSLRSQCLLDLRAAIWAKKALGKASPGGSSMPEWSHRPQHSKGPNPSLEPSLAPGASVLHFSKPSIKADFMLCINPNMYYFCILPILSLMPFFLYQYSQSVSLPCLILIQPKDFLKVRVCMIYFYHPSALNYVSFP